ncbi:MAG: hypothetical protein M3N53_12930 [Actinomycetota bacterium]|nr:hypothetical protein [Actinomycetota bacterium]
MGHLAETRVPDRREERSALAVGTGPAIERVIGDWRRRLLRRSLAGPCSTGGGRLRRRSGEDTTSFYVRQPGPPYYCAGAPATIAGTDGDDELLGTPLPDVIVALEGDDVIEGAGGDDVICGNGGNDLLGGNAGSDRSFGGLVMSWSMMGLLSSPGPPTDSGDDELYGGFGNDDLEGYEGTDVYRGGRGSDLLNNGPGDDVFSGRRGRDTLTFFGSNLGETINLKLGTSSGASDNDSISSVENVMASDGPDKIIGDGGSNLLSGMAGDDVLRGSGGTDRVDGGTGVDSCRGGEVKVRCETD